MTNRGKYRYPVDIIDTQGETGEKNKLGENVLGEIVVAKNVFANIETRAGSLLAGRAADTVMSKVTHKITYPYQNYPVRLIPSKHKIRYKNVDFSVEYFLNEALRDVEAQVFVSEDTKGL